MTDRPCRTELLNHINAVSFAVDEVKLYLDTHPQDDMIPSSRTQKYKNLLGGILCPEKVKLMQ